jgi:predicted peptidase
MIVVTSVLVSVLFAAPAGNDVILPKGFVELFESCEYRRTAGKSQPELFRYRLFVPRNQTPGEEFPLLVWLHGAGENGSDNWRNLKWLDLILETPGYIEKYRFFILVVQCPQEGPGWSGGSGAGNSKSPGADDMLSVTYEILQKTLREQPVNKNRVYLSGVSSGGSASWEMALRYPEVFAAVVPMASGGGDVSRAARLVNIPVWAFHNEHDDHTSPDGDKQMVAAVENAGGNVLLTLVPSDGHDCWQETFLRRGVMTWMLDQRRGTWICWTPPGCKPWKWWHVFGVPGAFLALVAIGWCSERNRRRRRRAQVAVLAESERTHGA